MSLPPVFRPVATRRMVLVHGAWQGAWAFDFWLPELAALGWRAEAVDLPGNGCNPEDRTPPQQVDISRYVAHVLSVIDREEEPVVLVGHSGGGLSITAVAEAAPGRVAALVYLAGMMLPSGMSYLQLVGQCREAQPGIDWSGIAPWLSQTPDGLCSVVDPKGACRIFLHDCEPGLARKLAGQLRPQAHGGRDVAPVWTAQRFGCVPRLYVEARADRSLLLPAQRRMQALVPGAHVISLDCGHVPQVVLARESARRVCDVLERGA